MTHDPAKPLVLVDASSYLYRAYHALPPLTNSRGEPTGAVYGVINMLRKLLDEYAPELIAVVFDAKGKTFRDELFEQYKAHRPPMPDDLRAQVGPLHDLIRAMGLPLLIVEGVEADDVIGTLACQAAAAGQPVLISTGDKDMAQLVDEHITLFNSMSNTLLDPAGVETKFGVKPRQIIDYLSLVGDSVDNIPGIPKVGPKTAAKWLTQYGDLDNLLAHADEIGGKVGENLRQHIDTLPLSRQLATIHIHVPLDVEFQSLVPGDADREALKTLYQRLEFRSLLGKLLAEQEQRGEAPPQGADYQLLLSESDWKLWLQRLQQAPQFAFDLESTSLDYMDAEIVGFSFALQPFEAAYLPVAHRYTGAPEQLPLEKVLSGLRPLLEDAQKTKIGQNLKYDTSVLANHGVTLRGVRFDTMLESYVLDSTASTHKMDELALKHLGCKTITYEDVAGKGAKQICFDQVPVEVASEYAAEDADIALRLHHHFWPKLEREPRLRQLFEEIEMPLVPILSTMERTGVLVDAAMLRRQSTELAKRMNEVEQQAWDLAGERFNLGSPKQIQQILFEKHALPVIQKTAKGQPSTAESVLQELAGEFELPSLILEYRSLSKLKSTYTDQLPERINRRTGRVHTSYHQAVAATGRLSSSDPNLQNIPIRTSEGRRIRQAFIAPAGHRIVAADYSQIELRIMAHLSNDDGLLSAFRQGRDIHQTTAAEIFGTSPERVTGEQRRSAKAINFGLIYGMSAFGLARQLGIERGAAQEYVNLYFERYPGVKDFMDGMRRQARETGYVETVFGRRLYLPEINSRNGQRRQYAERAAINAPMQGTAADIIKRAMITMARRLEEHGDGIRMIMQVHDELVFEVREDRVESATAAIRECMTGAAQLVVPLDVETGVGSNWDEAH